MPRVTTKQKGNRFDKADYHVPYYTTAFFNPGSDKKDDKEDKKVPHTVKLPIKIAADGDDSRANVTNFEMRGISHFDNNVEAVLESLSQLKERVIKPKRPKIPMKSGRWPFSSCKSFATVAQHLSHCKKQLE